MSFATAAAAQTAAPTPQVAPPPATPENIWHLDLSTGGRVSIQLRPDIAPGHVERIKTLTRRGFYNGLTFHRVIDGFMAQGGDPQGDGTGGSDLPDLNAEFNILPHVRGAVSAARGQEVNSANSQFFIMLAPRFSLDNKYTAFGRVISGMSFVDAIEKGEPPAAPSRIVRASLGSDNVPPPTAAEIAAAAAAPAPAAAPLALPAVEAPAEPAAEAEKAAEPQPQP
ncbi:MAG TPA: peptidylprolyl isomerase [Allosphingosinicella sp.]